MARKPSVILTTAEKRDLAKGIRAEIKDKKSELSMLKKQVALHTREAKAVASAFEKDRKALQKELDTFQKNLDKVAPKKAKADVER